MAQRRMFSLKIVDTDNFIEMPTSARLLYYDLSMRADDDGFVNAPHKIIKMTGASLDDYKILLAKQYIFKFESGVCVIKDWKVHNYIAKDRYQKTLYQDEKTQLGINNNGSYTKCIQHVYGCETQGRIGEEREGKDRLGKDIYENSSQADDINHNTDIVVESTSEEQLENEFSSIYIPEKTNKKKYKQAVSSRIIETWNNQSSLPTHNQAKLDKEIKKKHIDQMSFHSEDDIISAIESYAKILESGDYYFNYRWSFWDFIVRGLDKFVPDMKPYENFRRKSFNEEPTKEEKEAKYRERLEYNRKLFEKLDKERKNEQR